MKTFKYYRVPKGTDIPIDEYIDVYPYTEDGADKIVGVFAENHTSFENAVSCSIQTFEEVKEFLENSHLNKQLNKEITDKIKLKYSTDDEIALFHKQGTTEFTNYETYRNSIKEEVLAKKIKYGLKQGA